MSIPTSRIGADYHRKTVEVAERFADGLATRKELIDSYQVGEHRPGSLDEGDFDPQGEGEDFDPYCVPWPSSAACASAACSGSVAAEGTSYWCAALAGWTRPGTVMDEERAAQANLLREICGNPFRPMTPGRPWLAWGDGAVVRMATAIYEERAFDRMPYLADALEDAGCTDGQVLSHCRGPGPHVRGCFVLDLVLGKN